MAAFNATTKANSLQKIPQKIVNLNKIELFYEPRQLHK